MRYFTPREVVKFKLKSEFDSEQFATALHRTADGFYVGVYQPRHVLRTPEIKRDGQVVQAAEAKVLPECIVPMTPSGENLMLPNYQTQKFERVIFTMDKIDEDTAYAIDHTDHMPPGRKCDPAWKPDAQRQAEEAAAKTAQTAHA